MTMPGSDGFSGDPGSTASSLVAGVKALDPGAWRQLAALYGPLIYGWVRRAGVRAEDASDVTQEVFRAVARAAPQLRHDRPGDTFRGWLWTVTRNKLRDAQRRQTGRPRAAGGTDAQELLLLIAEPDTGTGPGPPEELGGVLQRAVELVRGEFEPLSWDAFWRVTVEGRSAAAVAAELGVTTNAVYVARSRILRRLRELLADGDPPGADPPGAS
jgi:RNA polymerase sigma-70 factor (ECF subfamily)